jgi:thiamine pyrophosphokinase
MQALLLAGGEAPPRERLAPRLGSFGLICAADSGLDTLRAWGIEPDLIVGDMDSLSDPAILEEYPEALVLRASRDKDETDTELGLLALAERGADRIVLAGGGGGRLDHLLAIRALFERRLRPAEWHTANEAIYLVEAGGDLRLEARPGSIVSAFPLAAGSSGMWSEGLDWPLAGLSWGPGQFGVSNVASSGPFSVRAGSGDILVILDFGAR